MGTSLYDDLLTPPNGSTGSGGLYDDLLATPPVRRRDRFLSKVPERVGPWSPRRTLDDLMVGGADLAATIPRVASALGGAGAKAVGALAGEDNPLARRFGLAQSNLMGLADSIEAWGAPRDGWQALPKLAAGVGKYVAMGPAAGLAVGSAEAFADPRTSQTALVAELDRVNNPVAQAVGGVARNLSQTGMGRVVGDLAFNEATGAAMQGLRRLFGGAPTPATVHAPVSAPVETPQAPRALNPGWYEMPGETPLRWPEGAAPQPIPTPRLLNPGQYDLPARSPSTVAAEQRTALEELLASLDAQPRLLPSATGGPRPMPAKAPSTVAAERAARSAALEADPFRQAMLSRAEREAGRSTDEVLHEVTMREVAGDDLVRAPAARAPSGGRRDVAKVASPALFDELDDLGRKLVDAQGRSVYNFTEADVSGTQFGVVIPTATRKGSGPSMQAKALKNIEDLTRIHDEVTGELKRRGFSDDDIFAEISKREEARLAPERAAADRLRELQAKARQREAERMRGGSSSAVDEAAEERLALQGEGLYDDLVDPELRFSGTSTPAAVRAMGEHPVASTVTGAAVGAASDEENRVRGAVLGGAAGLAGSRVARGKGGIGLTTARSNVPPPVDLGPVPTRTVESVTDALRKTGDVRAAAHADALDSFMKGSKVRHVLFRGDFRGDRLGSRLRKDRSTSGRFYFTDDPDIASKYGEKPDLGHEGHEGYAKWFKVQTPDGTSDLDSAWSRLTPEQRARVEDTVRRASLDDDGNMVFGEVGESIREIYPQLIREHRGNWLSIARDNFLDSGALYNNERDFMPLLERAGLVAEFDSPHDARSVVSPFFVSLRNPVDAGRVPDDLMQAWRTAARTDRTQRKAVGRFDPWNKKSRSFREWVEAVESGVAEGSDTWATSLPEKAVKIAQRLGYDGIRHDGGVSTGGKRHNVWIAFEPEQVKSAIGNRGTYSPTSPDIRYSGGPAEVGAAAIGYETAPEDASEEEKVARALMLAGGAAGARYLFKRGGARGTAGRVPTPTPDIPVPKAKGYTGPVNVDDFANIAKFGLDASGEQRLRATVDQVVRQRGIAPKGVQSWAEVSANAKALGLDADALLKKGDAKRLNGAEMLAIREIVADNVRALDLAAKELASNPSAERAAALDVAMSNLERQNDALLSRFVKARTQAGRDLNNLKIIAQQTLDPAYWLAKAAKQMGVESLPADVHAALSQRLAAGDKAGVATMVAGLRTHTVAQKVTQLWKVGLLTNPRTHIANAVSNTVMGAAEIAKDVPAYVADRLLMAATGQASKAAPTRQIVAASWQGARAGIEDAKKILRGELVPDALGKFDLGKGEVDFGNKVLNAYGNWVFRALSASDKVFSMSALKRSLAEQATVIAQREGLTGDALTRRVATLVDRPLEPMAVQAIADAQVATFQNPNAISESIAKLKGGLKQIPRIGEYVGESVLPFSRTPGAVASSFVRYSPVGLADGLLQATDVWAQARRGTPNLAAQRKAVEDIGRGAVGTTLLWLGYSLAKDRLMSGAFPADAGERARWQQSNRQENSVLVGGKWRSVEKLGPAGVLMATGANLAEILENPETASWGDVVAATGSSMLKTVGEQSSLTGLESITEAIGDPKRAASRYVRQQTGSVVPAVVAGAARAVDPTMREAETIGDAVRARIPGASKQLPAKLDVFGEERRGEPGAVANLLDPTYARGDRRGSDPVVAELDRVGLGIAPLKRKKDETPAAFRARVKAVGAAMKDELRAAIESPTYTEDFRAEAERLAPEAEYRGQSVDEIARSLQREYLKDVITNVRRLMARGASDE